jgi:nucleoside-diphosphate-sugar epimerase
MRVAKPGDVFETNVEGSRRLIEAAKQAGIGKFIFVSSMSAYHGCESNYGKAKLAVEALLGEHDNAVIIRPGLVYGTQPGGVVGAMLKVAKKTRILPMVGTGDYRLYPCHEDDLLELVEHCVASPAAGHAEPLLAAHTNGIPLREIVTRLAGRKLIFLPVPWRLIWFALRALEQLGIKSRLKSDSVIGLVKSDPSPDFSATAGTPVSFRPLA